jgi:hypothetical protein
VDRALFHFSWRRDWCLAAELSEAKFGASTVGAFSPGLDYMPLVIAHLAGNARINIAPMHKPGRSFGSPVLCHRHDGGETPYSLIIAVVAVEAVTKQDRFALGRVHPLGKFVVALWGLPICLFE